MSDTKLMKERGGTINPFLDWSFKYLFGREETKDLLIGFLNLLLTPEHPVTDITYLNNERIPENPDLRECVFDVICRDSMGDCFLVEMQHVAKQNIRNRLLYYACRLIDEMGQRGEDWNYDIDRVYAICLMDFTYEKNPVLRSDYSCEMRATVVYSLTVSMSLPFRFPVCRQEASLSAGNPTKSCYICWSL